MRAILAVVLLLFILMAPTAHASAPIPVERCLQECDPAEVNGGRIKSGMEPVDVFLYAHIDSILNMAPLNTQRPGPEERDPAANVLMPTINGRTGACVPATGTCGDIHFKNNQFTMFSSPGLVEYSDEGWRTHQEPGLAADLALTGDAMRLYWYLGTELLPSNEALEVRAGVLPAVDLHARMETGRFVGRGAVIAESEPSAIHDRANLVTLPGQPSVYEFMLPLEVYRDKIPSAAEVNGFIVHVEWQQADVGENAELGQAQWRVHAGADFMPRLIVPAYEPLETVKAETSHYGGDMYLRWTVTPALGAYDIAEHMLLLEPVMTPPGASLYSQLDHVILKRSVDCDGQFKPVTSTWRFDHRNATLPDGRYILRASIPNLQSTYEATADFSFDVVDGVPEGVVAFEGASAVPGVELPALFVGLALVAVFVARRRA